MNAILNGSAGTHADVTSLRVNFIIKYIYKVKWHNNRIQTVLIIECCLPVAGCDKSVDYIYIGVVAAGTSECMAVRENSSISYRALGNFKMELNFITTLIKHDVNHNVKQCFKSKKPFISRKEEVMAIKNKFPTKIPLIVERYHKERNLPILDKSKFLVPEDITMSQFLVIIRNRIKIKPNQALYLIINNKSMLSMSLTMAQAYENYGDEDGFLYITYASQEVFGYKDDMNVKVSNQEVQAIRHRFPNKVPLYVERYVREREVPALGRNKFLVPQELTMSQFLYIIRTKMKLRDSQTLYLLVNDKVLVSHSMTMAQAYEQFRHHDGYLHITYAAQQVFG